MKSRWPSRLCVVSFGVVLIGASLCIVGFYAYGREWLPGEMATLQMSLLFAVILVCGCLLAMFLWFRRRRKETLAVLTGLMVGVCAVGGTYPVWLGFSEELYLRGLGECLRANVDRDSVFRWAMTIENETGTWLVSRQVPKVFGRLPCRTFDGVSVSVIEGGGKEVRVGWGGRDVAWGVVVELTTVQSGSAQLTNMSMRAVGSL